MAVSARLQLGLKTLNEVAQITPTPYAKGIIGVTNLIVQTATETGQNNKDMERVASRVLEIAIASSEALKSKAEVRTEEITLYVGQLLGALDRLASAMIQRYKKKGTLKRLLGRSSIAGSIKEAEAELERVVSTFLMHLQIQNQLLASGLGKQTPFPSLSMLEKSIEEARTEELNFLRSKLAGEAAGSSLGSNPMIPAPPSIFFGRDEIVQRLVDTLCESANVHVAILGPGGIGKTSLALRGLHDPRVKAIYGTYRFFVPCDALSDHDGLIAALSQAFNLPEKHFLVHLQRVARVIGDKMLLTLDNFETPWEPHSNRSSVERVLSQLGDIPNLSTIVTLRGAERPYGLPWARPFLPPLSTLDLAAARRTFIAISDIDENDPYLNALLAAVDNIPLAVTLMATQAQYIGCSALLSHWNSKKTAMVTRGPNERLSNLAVSIQVSLNSERFISCKSAAPILQILSLLPDGVVVADLRVMVPPDFECVSEALTSILQVSLGYVEESGRIRALSPVREHVKAVAPIPQDLFSHVFSHHVDLSRKARVEQLSALRTSMIRELTPQIGNIHSIINYAFQFPTLLPQGIQATVDIACYHRLAYAGSITTLLDRALNLAKSMSSKRLEGMCLLAKTWRIELEEQRACFEQLLPLLRECGEREDLGLALIYYSTYLYRNSKASESISVLNEVLQVLPEEAPVDTRVLAYDKLSKSLLYQGSVAEAMQAARNGLALAPRDSFSALDCYISLSNCYYQKALFTQASDMVVQAVRLMGPQHDWTEAVTLDAMGWCLFAQSRLKEAYSYYEKAGNIASQFERYDWVAYQHSNMGAVAHEQRNYDKASTHLHMAMQSNAASNRKYSLALNVCAIGSLELYRGNLITSWSHLNQARKMFKDSNVAGDDAETTVLIPMGDTLFQMNRIEESFPFYTICCLLYRKHSNRLGLARSLLRIGDVFYAERDLDTAKSCFAASLDLIRYLGVSRHIGDTLLRLGIISSLLGDSAAHKTHTRKAKQFYIAAEDDMGIQSCEDQLQKLESEPQSLNDFPSLPLSTSINV